MFEYAREATDKPFIVPLITQTDARGHFWELYNVEALARLGLGPYVQANLTQTADMGVVRGLHLQEGAAAQAKLVFVLSGAAMSVAVDLRAGGFGDVHMEALSAHTGAHAIPVGYAHGVQVLAPDTRVMWLVSHGFDPAAQRTLHFADPTLAIAWPREVRWDLVSQRDLAGEPLYAFKHGETKT